MGKRIALVVLDQFADWEGAFLSSALMDPEVSEGNHVYWASTDISPKKSIGNMRILPDLSVNDIPDSFDALILIGGNSWRSDEAKLVIPTVERFMQADKVVGFICDATYFAAREGFLNHVEHSGNDAEEMEALESYTNASRFRRENAISDHNVITANGNNPVEFAAEVLKALQVADPEAIEMWKNFYTMGYWNALRKYNLLKE